jgi:hypothetical protein
LLVPLPVLRLVVRTVWEGWNDNLSLVFGKLLNATKI